MSKYTIKYGKWNLYSIAILIVHAGQNGRVQLRLMHGTINIFSLQMQEELSLKTNKTFQNKERGELNFKSKIRNFANMVELLGTIRSREKTQAEK